MILYEQRDAEEDHRIRESAIAYLQSDEGLLCQRAKRMSER